MLLAILLFLANAQTPAPQTNYYIYILKLTRPEILTKGPTDAEKTILSDHAAYHAKLTKDGIEIAAGPTLDDDPLGIAIFTAHSLDEAKAIMNADPAVAHGVMTATLHPWRFAFGTAKPQSPKANP